MNHLTATGRSTPSSPPQEENPLVEHEAQVPLDFADLLDRMTPLERLGAYRSGTFSRWERTIWAARFPEEAPLVNGELEWIARNLADLD